MTRDASIHRLDGRHTSFLLLRRAEGLPEIVHWGGRLPKAIDPASVVNLRSQAVPRLALQGVGPEAVLLPTLGSGLFRGLSFSAHRAGRDWTARFEVDAIEQSPGRIHVKARDELACIALDIELVLHDDDDVLAMRTRIGNRSNETLELQSLAAGVFLLPEPCKDVLAFKGAWVREFVTERFILPVGRWSVESRRGRMSHDGFPAMIIGVPGFSEERGEVFGFHLGWSGNHRIWTEVLEDGRRMAGLEALFHPGEITLAVNEQYETPWAFASFSSTGLSDLSKRFHKHVREHVLRWPGRTMGPRPVILNTWEGVYFKHDVEALKRQAEYAAGIGVEMFVLDDGWFGRRDDATSSLGDWRVDPRKYPSGLETLVSHVRGLGMEFGLWVEPEMVNPDSDLYREHPDWVLGVCGRPQVMARNQLVLDITRPEVSQHLFETLDRLLSTHKISYLKWDMNRDLVAAGDTHGRPAYTRYVDALYALLDRLREAHPAMEIEACASGAARIDFGMLTRAHRVWTSDCTDALERASIQRGFLRFLPPELMGADISGNPNHQTGRRLTLDLRGAVALLGHLGIGLDLPALPQEELEELKGWIALYKRVRGFVHAGVVHMSEPEDGRSFCGVVSDDGTRAIYVIVQETMRQNRLVPPLRLPGLDPSRAYRVTVPGPQVLERFRRTQIHDDLAKEGLVLRGALLSSAGLSLPLMSVQTSIVLLAEAI